jgi:hypothetical protein
MVVGFQLASWYGILTALAVAYLLWRGFFATLGRDIRSIRRRLSPDPPVQSKAPIVVMGGPSCSYSKVPLNERRIEQENLLTRLGVTFLIENKEALVTVTKLEAGVRRSDDGREQRFEEFKAPALAPLHDAPVSAEVERTMFEGLVESDFQAAFVWWVRFTAPDGTRWEIAHDGAAHDFAEPRIVPQT